jgi:hypothetical protein
MIHACMNLHSEHVGPMLSIGAKLQAGHILCSHKIACRGFGLAREARGVVSATATMERRTLTKYRKSAKQKFDRSIVSHLLAIGQSHRPRQRGRS